MSCFQRQRPQVTVVGKNVHNDMDYERLAYNKRIEHMRESEYPMLKGIHSRFWYDCTRLMFLRINVP